MRLRNPTPIWRNVPLILPLILLPGTMLIVVPAGILWATAGTEYAAALAGPKAVGFWLGLALGLPGAAMSGWAMAAFGRHGQGTPAPWDPPRRLVVEGPYRHVRNPMLSGVFAMLFAEALLLESWPLTIWASVFFAGNAFWFPLVEEPGLVARFGDDYRRYRDNVPRWVPRVTPWRPP